MKMSNTSKNCHHKRWPSMEDDLKEAAARGTFYQFNEHLDHLDRILTPYGNTILHIHLSIVSKISTEFIKQVVGHCPKLLSQENGDGNTPLHIAARHGHTDAAEELIKQAEAFHDAIDVQSGELATEGKMEALREMLRKVNKNKETALHVAARNGRSLGVVKAILSKEDPHFTYSANDNRQTPLYLAVDNTCTNIVAELLNKTDSQALDYVCPDGTTTVLHKAVERWDTETVRMLLEKQNSLAKGKDEKGWTPLHLAASKGSRSMVATLLDKDTSIAYIGDKEKNMIALHIAVREGFKRVMDEIISKCPDCCKLTDKFGRNVLHHAVCNQNHEVLKAILENSSLIYLILGKDARGYTPVHLFKVFTRPLPSFILDEDTDAFILWKELYDKIGDSYLQDFPKGITYCQNLIDTLADEELKDPNAQNAQNEYLNGLGAMIRSILNAIQGTEEKRRKKREENIVLKLEKAKDSHLVVAALVATVTFAAAFTLPGGYISNENDLEKGTPILRKNSAFKAFVISDTMAMVLSISSVFIYFITVMLGYGPKYYWLIKTAFRFIFLAMGAMVVAFVTGTYAVLAPSLGLTIATCVIGLSFFLFLFYIFIRLIRDFPLDDDEDRVLTLAWLSCGGWWLKDYIKKRP